jgi:hypothetical protein
LSRPQIESQAEHFLGLAHGPSPIVVGTCHPHKLNRRKSLPVVMSSADCPCSCRNISGIGMNRNADRHVRNPQHSRCAVNKRES